MAATLTSTVSASVQWSYATALSTLVNPTVQGGFTYSGSTTNGTGAAGTADLIYALQTTIAGGGNTTFDLAGSLADWFGTTISMVRVKTIFCALSTATTASSIAFGNATNPLINWISAATSTIKILNGGCFLLASTGATGYAVTAATGDIVKILNNDGSNTATINVVFIGSSA